MAFKDQISLATLENNMQGPSAAVGKGGPLLSLFPSSTTATLLLYQAAVVVKVDACTDGSWAGNS